ncbi:UDP-glycosyltransferase UGT5-like [Daktulosphaira vitifoliae]|nr:UDP-glycosyltransferase UGT5-like [Daktulosphaira vitifoliae]
MSIIETIHCGKPVVGIPMFGDQPINIRFLEQKKVAVYVEYEDLNIEYFYGAIKTALSDNFRKNMKKLQLQYFDRPQTPLETAIYWAEYVIRNRGVSPNLLKTNQHNLCWTKTYLLDVVASLIFFITLTCYVTFYVLNKIIINMRQWFEDSSNK